MKSKTFYGIIFGFILLLIGIIVYLILTRPDSEKPAIIKHETEIKQDTRRMDSLLLEQELLRLQLKEDSIKSSVREKRLKIRVANLENKIEVQRQEVAHLIDSIPTLHAFVSSMDSLLSIQAERIDSLQTEKSIERMKFRKLLLAGDEKFNASISINGHLRDINDIRKKENRRLKKANRLLLVAIPVAFVGGVVLAK